MPGPRISQSQGKVVISGFPGTPLPVNMVGSVNSFQQGDSPANPGVPIPPGPAPLAVTPGFLPISWMIANNDVVDINISIDGGVTFRNLNRGQSKAFDNLGLQTLILQSQGAGGESYEVEAW